MDIMDNTSPPAPSPSAPITAMSSLSLNRDDGAEWPVDRVRSNFISFFVEKHQHTFWPSSPCVPHDDPTLLFANAGMNQYKPLFLGTCDPNIEMSTLKRAVNSQKCIRAGGKHNDLDDVGKDVYHHTFFEMLGNWSFGDYFKKEAIEMAYNCLVQQFSLDPDRLYATYFGGDDSSPADNEARDLWLQYLPSERVLPFDAKDNFWEMGATGPCGPCTEIHYDRIGNRDAAALVNMDDPNVIEIWNNVFIQFNREPDGSLRPLPHKHIDTGMGLERLTSILQNKMSNYDTDIFMPIFHDLRKILQNQGVPDVPEYNGKVGADDIGGVDMAYRVIADHIRTLSFSIADGAMPSNDGRGYVLRRVLRRAVRYGRSNLKAEIGFFSQLVPTVVRLFGGFYPELREKEDLITSVISEEETSFGQTLDKGLHKFEAMATKCASTGIFAAKDAHILYTTMGFPVDLTELMVEERGMKLDKEGFEKLMQHEIELSAKALQEKQLKASGGVDMTLEAEQTNYLIEKNIPVTQDELKYSREGSFDARILELYVGRNATDMYGFIGTIHAEDVGGKMIGIILDQTSFYAESGGQVTDTGMLASIDGDAMIQIENVQVYAGYVVHSGRLLSGSVCIGEHVKLSVDFERRLKIASNHTMTHVLNFALRHVLVLHPEESEKSNVAQQLDQKGSLVDDSKLRFDFSWNGPLSESQLAKIEQVCADRVKSAVPVESYVAPLADAHQISSLRAVFGEAYPDPVRVVSVSSTPLQEILNDPSNENWFDYSIEFCGGTHLTNTSEAEDFVLLNEEGIAKGVRRITAVTMQVARDAIELDRQLQDKLTAAREMDVKELEQEIKRLTVEVNNSSISAARKLRMKDSLTELSRKVIAWKKEQGANITSKIVAAALEAAEKEADSHVVCRVDFGLDGKVAKLVMAQWCALNKEEKRALLMVTADIPTDKFMVFATANGCEGVDCKAWVTAATLAMDAKGGGKSDSAQFNVHGVHKIDLVLEKARAFFN